MDFSKYLNLGFSLSWLQELVNNDGNEILTVLDDLIEGGFSAKWIQELAVLTGHLFWPSAKMACAAVKCKTLCPVSASPGMASMNVMGEGMLQYLLHGLAGVIGKELTANQQVMLQQAVDIVLKLL